jgi:dTDP-4-dehydrorhamnose reductase
MASCVLITGASGLIGQYLVRTAPRWASDRVVKGLTHADLDLTDRVAVEHLMKSVQPDAVIHCAALSRTKDCEEHPDRARHINVRVTAHLAELSQHIPFVFLSSGEVFDGRAGWYRETDKPNPINVYGRTKHEAEDTVLRNPLHTVVRIVLTAGTSLGSGRSFVEEMCRVARTGQDVMLYGDEFRCPLPAGVIARALWALLAHDRPGLYHLGGSERLSRWDIGQALLPWFPELSGLLVKTSSREHQGAPRPADLSLNCEKIQGLLSFTLPGFRDWLSGRISHERDPWDYGPGVV